MIKPILSILIPYTLDRQSEYDGLYKRLLSLGVNTDKYNGIVEEISDFTGKYMSIGEKREMMYGYSKGLYSWQIDCDDDISDNAIELILQTIKNNPDVDCVTFEEYCLMNGQEFRSNHSLKYDDWADNFDGYDFVRTPFYKDVIRTEIAQSVPFEKIRFGEDHAWARALKPHLKTEYHIPQQLYRYIHNSKPEGFNERYGIV